MNNFIQHDQSLGIAMLEILKHLSDHSNVQRKNLKEIGAEHIVPKALIRDPIKAKEAKTQTASWLISFLLVAGYTKQFKRGSPYNITPKGRECSNGPKIVEEYRKYTSETNKKNAELKKKQGKQSVSNLLTKDNPYLELLEGWIINIPEISTEDGVGVSGLMLSPVISKLSPKKQSLTAEKIVNYIKKSWNMSVYKFKFALNESYCNDPVLFNQYVLKIKEVITPLKNSDKKLMNRIEDLLEKKPEVRQILESLVCYM